MNRLNYVSTGKSWRSRPLWRRLTFLWPLLILNAACQTSPDQEASPIQAVPTEAEFVGSQTCTSCHEEQYASWQDSHHDQAMKIADSTTILADFNNTRFESNNVKSSFFKKGNEYYVNTQGEDGNYHDYKIHYTFGVTPLQQYIVQFPNGKYQCLQTAWDSELGKWFDLQPDLNIRNDEWIHWTGGGMRWNTACADCHSTDLRKNYDNLSNSYNTTFSEINVSCEACHGPGSSHLEYYQNPEPKGTPPPMFMEASNSSFELVDKCARCHSRRGQLTPVYDYTGSFLDHYNPSLLVYPTYELDGQIRDEDYVYASFVQSKMYQNGISCRDCHDVHSLKLKAEGNALCMTCHEPRYDTPEHHFHEAGSEGAQCINCHMTGKIYMGNDFRRDHSFRIPRPDQSLKYGTPNACNGCHDDKSSKWASDFIDSKYGPDRADHFSDHLLAGSEGDAAAFYRLLAQTDYPDIARATALRQYANRALSMPEITTISKFLQDSSSLVRNEAVVALDNLSSRELAHYLEPLLMDSVRLVRISAARYFNKINMVPQNRGSFEQAQKESEAELELNADFASGQHQIAILQQSKGNIEAAKAAYRKSIEVDNYFNASRINLALILYEQGDTKGAEELYLKVAEQEPDYSYAFYMLGLLYHETGDSPKALQYLSQACEKEPVNIRAFYNYALKLQEAERSAESIPILDRALQLSPNNEELLYVMLIGQLNIKQYNDAYNSCLKLIEIAPQNAQYQQILARIKQDMQ